MMPSEKNGLAVDRRGFLRSIGGVSVAGTAALAGTVVPAEAAENASDRKKARYKETEHVMAFYRTNRF